MVCASDLIRCCLMQERHWKRAAARAVAHEIAAVTRSSMLKHTAAIDEELQSCQQKVLCLACLLVMPAESLHSLPCYPTLMAGHCFIKVYSLLLRAIHHAQQIATKSRLGSFHSRAKESQVLLSQCCSRPACRRQKLLIC
jgi:hypothetical protein